MTPTQVAVLGGGNWGCALALVLVRNGHRVRLWEYDHRRAAQIAETHQCPGGLPGITLDLSIQVTSSLGVAAEGAEVIVVAVPTNAVAAVAREASAVRPQARLMVSASKGIDPQSLKTPRAMLVEGFAAALGVEVVALSGPSFALEVAQQHPTAVSAAATQRETAQQVQSLFSNEYFRVYTSLDPVGVEVGGALKNVIAIAAGLSDGLGFGDNARAALVTRGLVEITRLGIAMGANPLTFAGLAGLGDLVLTTTGELSRNRTFGKKLAAGIPPGEALAQIGQAVEGYDTSRSAVRLAEIFQIDMPIARQVHDIIHLGKDPREAVRELMRRPLTREDNILG